jgi:preprotein translocase SecE subunit
VGKKEAKQPKKAKFSFKQSVLKPIGGFLANATEPVRSSKLWKFLRRTILRSPFRGYFVSSFKELKKVTWPDRKTAWKLTATVIVFSFAFAALIQALDFVFDKLARQLFMK